jgi:hypothetical protein
MLTGQQIKLERNTMAIGTMNGRRSVLTLPAGETILVLSHRKNGGMLNVFWQDRTLTMFEIDVETRSTDQP